MGDEMRIVFMGTPDFALASLVEINKFHDVIAVYTKIDKVNARGNKVNFSPVKSFALENNIEIFQPKSFNDEKTVSELKNLNPDIIVVVAFGKILPQEVLDIPKFGVINVHSSLLPKYRGAAPINMALINGDEKTGVSVMEIVKELDAGPVISFAETKIEREDNFESLHDRLKIMGAKLLVRTLEDIESGNATYTEQDESSVSFVKPFKKSDLIIDFSKSSEEIFNFVRGLSPLPTAFCKHGEKILKIYELRIHDEKYGGKNGEVVASIKGLGFVVKTKDASVIITKAKPENKKAMSGNDMINGKILNVGDVLC